MDRVICIGEGGKSTDVPVGENLKQNMASRREKKREKSGGWAVLVLKLELALFYIDIE